MSFISRLNPSKDVVKLVGMCEAAVGGWGTLVFEVGEGSYASPHLVGLVVCEEALYPPSVGLLGLFDAAPRVYSGSNVQRTVSQPKG